MTKLFVLASTLLLFCATEAAAVSESVKQACKSDYVAYCSQHKVGSSGLRSCMRARRKMLTAGCIKALGSSDEVTEQDIRQYKREMENR